ncbi:MAG: hypothetical protein DRP08_04615 [Candidatus Aenigmatarchaeota archaeon]|nr:MAG: hypothetical protein DRP08_04615 [Candidatus Aenigmarchaeota archaeon]
MIDTLLASLHKVRKTGNNKWQACCPAHEDSDPSLAITTVSDGRILIHCFAGCSPLDILAAVDMSMTDLFPDGALANELRGATPWIRSQRRDDERKVDNADMVMRIVSADREKGKVISNKDLKAEREAYLQVRSNT